MSKKQEKKQIKNTLVSNNNNYITNSDINDPNSYIHKYWISNEIVDAVKIVINKDEQDHSIEIEPNQDVSIDNIDSDSNPNPNPNQNQNTK